MPNYNIVLQEAPDVGEELSPELIRLRDRAKIFASAAKSRRTREAYSKSWAQFEEWCRDHGVTSLPADPIAVASYVAHLAEEGIRPTSINLSLVAVSQAHKLMGFSSPTTSSAVRETLKGVRREIGTATRQASPLLPEHIRRIVDTLGDDPIGLRDRALLLIGFAGASIAWPENAFYPTPTYDIMPEIDPNMEIFVQPSRKASAGRRRRSYMTSQTAFVRAILCIWGPRSILTNVGNGERYEKERIFHSSSWIRVCR